MRGLPALSRCERDRRPSVAVRAPVQHAGRPPAMGGLRRGGNLPWRNCATRRGLSVTLRSQSRGCRSRPGDVRRGVGSLTCRQLRALPREGGHGRAGNDDGHRGERRGERRATGGSAEAAHTARRVPPRAARAAGLALRAALQLGLRLRLPRLPRAVHAPGPHPRSEADGRARRAERDRRRLAHQPTRRRARVGRRPAARGRGPGADPARAQPDAVHLRALLRVHGRRDRRQARPLGHVDPTRPAAARRAAAGADRDRQPHLGAGAHAVHAAQLPLPGTGNVAALDDLRDDPLRPQLPVARALLAAVETGGALRAEGRGQGRLAQAHHGHPRFGHARVRHHLAGAHPGLAADRLAALAAARGRHGADAAARTGPADGPAHRARRVAAEPHALPVHAAAARPLPGDPHRRARRAESHRLT